MRDMFSKLLAMKQISFKEGGIQLLNQNMVIFPTDYLVVFSKWMLEKHPELIPEIYEESKEYMRYGFGKKLAEQFHFKAREFINWLFNITTLAGWGKAELVKIDVERGVGIIRIYDSPVAMALKGKVDKPVDFIWAGIGAGCASAVYKKEMDYIETKCLALGDPYCEIIFLPRDTINKETFEYKDRIILK